MIELYRSASQLKSTGRLAAAERLFKTIIRESHDSNLIPGAHFHIGEIALRAGKMKKARTHFRECLKYNPTHTQANRYLAEIPAAPQEETLFKMLDAAETGKPFIEKRLRDIFARKGFYLLKKHYYLPIPEDEDLSGEFFERSSPLAGLSIEEQDILPLMEQVFPLYLAEFRGKFPSIENPPEGRIGFYLLNGSFMAVDAQVYYCFIRHYHPARLVEIGGGYSSLIAASALLENRRQTGKEVELTVIDPYPHPFLLEGFPGLSRLIREKVQTIPLDFFHSLQANDILFIDSSHVLKAGGDVQYEYLDILPGLNPGVLVHVHDISLPNPYPRVYYENRLFWNEQYLLQAFLAFNSHFEILWPGNYMMLKYPGKVREIFPEIRLMRRHFPDSQPTSFWMKVKP